MKKILFALMACVGLGLSGTACADETYYANSPVVYNNCTEFVDDYGSRTVCAPYYYAGSQVVYWDAHFGYWIGPRGYWGGGRYYPGLVPGYHSYYHSGAYHGFYHGGAYHYGGGYHGGGGHGGGHGGHR